MYIRNIMNLMCINLVSTQCQVDYQSPPGQALPRTLSGFPSPCTLAHHTLIFPPSDYGCGGGHGTCCRNERCPESQQHTSMCACMYTHTTQPVLYIPHTQSAHRCEKGVTRTHGFFFLSRRQMVNRSNTTRARVRTNTKSMATRT